ncbi:hypothetical protein [Myroides guanonis]|nr:hypothetical protein [Myroides guanonis]
MKKSLLFLLTITLMTSCSNEDNTINDKDKLVIKHDGKLKSTKVIVNSSVVDEKLYSYIETTDFLYGTNGFVSETKTTRIDKYGESFAHTTFGYDGNYLINKTYLEPSYRNDVVEKFYYVDELITTSNYYSRGKSVREYYSYDSFKNLIKREIFHNEEEWEATFEFEYTNENVNKLILNTRHPIPTQILNYEYDNKHNPYNEAYSVAYRRIKYISKNNVVRVNDNEIQYEYNAKGYPIKSIDKNNDVITTYEYY